MIRSKGGEAYRVGEWDTESRKRGTVLLFTWSRAPGLPSLESALLPNVFRFTAKLKISLPKFINHIFHAYK